MKVYEGPGPVLPKAENDVKKKGAGEGDFQKLMQEASLQTEAKEGKANHSIHQLPPSGIQIVKGVEGIQETPKELERKQVINELQQTLDLVDFYAEKLADSSLPASGMNPLIDHLEDRLSNLQSMETSPEMPEPLKPVISDMLLTIGTEIAKFRRGEIGRAHV